MRPLFLFTPLPELWEIFNTACSISAFDIDGLPSLSALETVINFNDLELGVTYQDFWTIMQYFLTRLRQRILLERKRKNGSTS